VTRRFDAVIFDMGGTLTRSFGDMMQGQLDRLGLTHQQFFEVILGPLDHDTDHPWHRLERGEITYDEYQSLHHDLVRAAGYDEFPAPPSRQMMFDHMTPSPEMVGLARELRADGYTTAILTNNVKEFDGWQSIVSADEIADVIVDSCRVGMRKPTVEIYEFTLKAVGDVAPERALFLDDFHWNVVGAQRAGLATVHVQDHTIAVAEARALLAGHA
jgi:putative hydrolase of the HAD superfamily